MEVIIRDNGYVAKDGTFVTTERIIEELTCTCIDTRRYIYSHTPRDIAELYLEIENLRMILKRMSEVNLHSKDFDLYGFLRNLAHDVKKSYEDNKLFFEG